MPNQVLWADKFTSRGLVLSTEMNSITNNNRTNAGTEINNGTNLDQYGKVEFQATFAGGAPAAGGFINIYTVVAADDTNYEDGSSSVDPGSHRLVATIPLRNVTTAQRLTSRLFQMEPSKTKFILENRSGSTFPASGSTLTLYTCNDELQ